MTNWVILVFFFSPTQSIGLLSYTFLRSTGKEDIVVPMVISFKFFFSIILDLTFLCKWYDCSSHIINVEQWGWYTYVWLSSCKRVLWIIKEHDSVVTIATMSFWWSLFFKLINHVSIIYMIHMFCYYCYVYLTPLHFWSWLFCELKYEAWLWKRRTRMEKDFTIFSWWLEQKCRNNSWMVSVFQWSRPSMSGDCLHLLCRNGKA